MHSHLVITGKSGDLALKPDDSVTITDKNPMFNDVEMFTQDIPLSFDLNRHLLKNMDDVDSTMRASDIENERFQFTIDGIPFRSAAIKIQDGARLEDTVDVRFDATNRTFKDMIADMRCRDVTVDDDILIGEKIGDVEVNLDYTEKYIVSIDCWAGSNVDGYEIIMNQDQMQEVFQPFALGYSYPGECYELATHEAIADPNNSVRTYDNPNQPGEGVTTKITVRTPHVKTSYINTVQPYPAAKYCNSRISYPHHKVDTEDGVSTGNTSDEIVPASERSKILEDKSPYWVLPADRSASGICFYVGYFLERLFKSLGVAYDMTALTNIEDFNYLAFFTTSCHYDAKAKAGATLSNEEQINKWLESRGCGGRIHLKDNKPETRGNLWAEGERRLDIADGTYQRWRVIGNHGNNNQGVSSDITNGDGSITIQFDFGAGRVHYVPNTTPPGSETYENVFRDYSIDEASMTAKVMQMFANSDNFPDADVTEVIESLENSFGVRFCYDAEINKVTVRLLRDMFRDQQQPIHFNGIVTKTVKIAEDIKGVRMRYSAESDLSEQRDNVRYGKRDYNTTYDYIDYQQERTKFASFEDVTEKVDIGNYNGYCDLATGDFYRIKVSSDASTSAELHPVVFEVAGMKGVEMGDCSKNADDDGAIKEFTSSFVPVDVNDVSYRGKNYSVQESPLLVPFIDEDMEHEFLIKKILNPLSTKYGSLDVVYELCLSECYDPTKADDGQSPLQHHDWGLTIGILRPGNNVSSVISFFDENYDGFGTSKWTFISSQEGGAITSDSYDHRGNFLGLPNNTAGALSLKIRAYKPFRYKLTTLVPGSDSEYVPISEGGGYVISTNPSEWDDTWLIPCQEDEKNNQGLITVRRRSRGLCDTYMSEFFHFLLNRQKYHIEAICTAAELADIPNKWLRRFEIDGKVGWINLLTYPVSVENGIGKVELEFFAL